MSYLGNAPARSFISFERQVFSIVNSQTAYALSHSVTNENDIRLVVNNVVQEPGSGKAYTATGTALTLSAALTNGTDEMYCVFLGRATATNAPGAGSVGTVQLADLNVTSGKIANDAVTLAKMASGTDGNIISYDASGNPVAVATGNDGQVLTSAGAGAPPVFETPASATNTPCFFASCSSDISLANNTLTKAAFSNQVFDVGGVYNNSTYRFTPGFAGKSFISSAAWSYDSNQYQYWIELHIYKNGSEIANFTNAVVGGERFERMYITGNLIVAHDDNDYYEIFFRQKQNGGNAVNLPTGSGNNAIFRNYFYGYKIIE